MRGKKGVVDPRSQSSEWRCAQAIQLFRKGQLSRNDVEERLTREGLTENYVCRFINSLEMLWAAQHERRLKRRRELYAQKRKLEKERLEA